LIKTDRYNQTIGLVDGLESVKERRRSEFQGWIGDEVKEMDQWILDWFGELIGWNQSKD